MKRVLCTILALTLCLTTAFALATPISAEATTDASKTNGPRRMIYFYPEVGEGDAVSPKAYMTVKTDPEITGVLTLGDTNSSFAKLTYGKTDDGFLTVKPNAVDTSFAVRTTMTGYMSNANAKYITVCYRVVGETFDSGEIQAGHWGDGVKFTNMPFRNGDDGWNVVTSAARDTNGNWWGPNTNFTVIFPGLKNADSYLVIGYVAFSPSEEDVAVVKAGHNTWLETIQHIAPAPVIDLASNTFYEAQTVTITAEAGMEIRYTLDGSEPTAESTLYTAPLTISETATLKAIAVKGDKKSTAVTREYVIMSNTCKDPVIELPGAWFPAGSKCTITSETEDAVIHYTLDGSDPTAESPVYTEPFVVEGLVTIKAIAMKEGFTASQISKVEVKKQGKDMYYWVFSNITRHDTANAYKGTDFSLLDGYNIGNDTDGSLKLPFNESGRGNILSWFSAYEKMDQYPNAAYPYVKICYKSTVDVDFMVHFDWFNNCEVSGKATADETSFSHSALEKTDTYKTVVLNMAELSPIWEYLKNGVKSTNIAVQATGATAEDYFNLKYIAFFPTAEAAEPFDMVSVPTFSVAGGFYNEKQTLEISCATEGAKIYYTTDGSDPTASSTLYTGAIELTSNMTVKAIAIKDGMLDSGVVSAVYEISMKAKTPEVDLPAGKYDTAKTVTISCATPGAKIYYTTDGSTPSATNGTLYEGSITLKESCILRAIAIADGMDPSTVKSVNYKFEISAEANTTGNSGNSGNNGGETTAAPEEPKEAGCASVIGMSALIPALLVLGGAMIIKKKEN